MTAVGGECAAAYGEGLAGLERVNAVDGPAAEDVVNDSVRRSQEASSPADWEFPHRRCLKHLRAIEIGTSALFAEVANVGRRAGIGR